MKPRIKGKQTPPIKHRVVREPDEGDLHRVQPEESRKETRETTRIQTIEVPKDSKPMSQLKTTFMVVMMLVVVGILGVLLYSTFGKATSADPPKTSTPTVVPKEITVIATKAGSTKYNQTVRLDVTGETTGYVLLTDPGNGNSVTVPLINGVGACELTKGGPDLSVAIFDAQGKSHSWKMSELLGGQ